jgi:hypothetical protein
MGFMVDSQIPASLGRTFLISKEDNLYVRVQQRPAFQRSALNYVAMAIKRLRSGKDGQHPRSFLSRS